MKDELKKNFESLLKNGEYAEAEKLLVPYMKENPDDWDAKLLYGTCRMMQGDTETAKFVNQQAQGYFESGKEIPEEQKSFWGKYTKLIFYGAIGTALVLTVIAYVEKQMQDVFEVLYAEPMRPKMARLPAIVDRHPEIDRDPEIDRPAMPHMEAERHDALFSKGQE